mmetsp:Transcript_144313/g.366349  ORF Transcript_144313/g.366349 Transcript_144313/m.366349 type:complete len:98 (-) Transcript_144313:274-567(-)
MPRKGFNGGSSLSSCSASEVDGITDVDTSAAAVDDASAAAEVDVSMAAAVVDGDAVDAGAPQKPGAVKSTEPPQAAATASARCANVPVSHAKSVLRQ